MTDLPTPITVSSMNWTNQNKTTVSTRSRSTFNAVRSWWTERREQIRSRRVFENLLTLDDAMLKDIGATRDEVIRVSQLPMNVSAAQELKKITSRRRAALRRPPDPRYWL